MIILNYAHPLTDAQLDRIAAVHGKPAEVRNIAVHIDRDRPLADVALALADAAQLTAETWQTQPLLINPPGLAPLALALIAELHGRCGYFPAILNIRPVANATPPRYEVAEIINLQAQRDGARGRR